MPFRYHYDDKSFLIVSASQQRMGSVRCKLAAVFFISVGGTTRVITVRVRRWLFATPPRPNAVLWRFRCTQIFRFRVSFRVSISFRVKLD